MQTPIALGFLLKSFLWRFPSTKGGFFFFTFLLALSTEPP